MIFPSEIVAKHLVPTVRYMMARELEKRGLTEDEIASKLSLSQSAVSKYKGGKIKPEALFLKDKKLREKVKIVAEGMVKNRMTKVQALAEFLPLILEYENRGKICQIHEKVMPELLGLNCDLCMEFSQNEFLEEQKLLSNLRQAVKVLEGTRGFANVIPKVGSNIAMAKEGAKEVSEVAAVPGGIYEVKDVVKVPAPPEFGGSTHVAEVILAVRELDPTKRAAINISYSGRVIERCKALGLGTLEVDAKDEGSKDKIQKAILEGGLRPDVIYHKGGYGIEPITYVLASDAVDVARMTSAILRGLYSDLGK